MNPFVSFGPLCPWNSPDHLAYYASVDNTETAYLQFESASEAWHLQPGRAAVLITGENGCGKSSLAHRCVLSLQNRIGKPPDRLWIADLSRETPQNERSIPQKIQFVIEDLLYRSKDNESILSSAERDIVFSSSDPARVASNLSQRLSKRKVVLILIPPKIELPRELSSYVEVFYRANIVLFTESTEPAVADACGRLYSSGSDTPILRLSVGKITAPDGAVFRDKRFALVDHQTDQLVPRIPDEVIHRLLQARTARAAGLSVRELERVCAHAYKAAQRRGDHEVKYADIADWYVENAHG